MPYTKQLQSTLDTTKKLAISGLASKKEKQQTYPIAKKDLLYIFRCPFCQSSRLKHLTEVSLTSGLLFFRTSVCQDCTYVFRSISPSFAWFKKCWGMIDTGKLEVFNPASEKHKKLRYKEYLDMIRKHICHGSALEIGGGYGTGAKLLKKAGFRIEVVESEISKARYIKNSLKIPVVDDDIIHFLNTTKKQYDLVIFSNCLEHLDHPISVMKKLARILKPGGFILLAVPILWDYVNWTDALYLTHKTNFSQEHLLALILRSGFKALEMKYIPYFFGVSQELEIVFILTDAIRPSPFFVKPTLGQRKKIINEIGKLYRLNLPFSSNRLKEGTIQYQVANIDQFFQTVNLGGKKVIPPRSKKDFIKIIPKHIKK